MVSSARVVLKDTGVGAPRTCLLHVIAPDAARIEYVFEGRSAGRGDSDALREASEALSTAIRRCGWGAVMAGKCLEGGALSALAVAVSR